MLLGIGLLCENCFQFYQYLYRYFKDMFFELIFTFILGDITLFWKIHTWIKSLWYPFVRFHISQWEWHLLCVHDSSSPWASDTGGTEEHMSYSGLRFACKQSPLVKRWPSTIAKYISITVCIAWTYQLLRIHGYQLQLQLIQIWRQVHIIFYMYLGVV